MQNPDPPLPQHWAVRFFTIFTGQAFSLVGSALVQFALVWFLTLKTGSATVPPNMFWIMVSAMFVVGLMMPMANGPIQALFQSLVEPDMQGRVMSLIGSVASAMMPFSLMIAGPVTDATSLQAWFWFAGITCILVSLGGFFIPALYHIEENHQKNQVKAEATPAD